MKDAIYIKSTDLGILGTRLGLELKEEKHFEIASQFIKCSTAVGANVHEAKSAESRKDFIHKMKIAHKELIEVRYWVKIIIGGCGKSIPADLESTLQDCERLLYRIIATTIKNTP
ncbi:MAG: four helix bundle protein [Flavobacteriales bacterium]